jgi:hypothetical protein
MNTKHFDDLNTFLNWINANGRYQDWQSFLMKQGLTIAMIFNSNDPLGVSIGVWNGMFGYNSIPTHDAYNPWASTPFPEPTPPVTPTPVTPTPVTPGPPGTPAPAGGEGTLVALLAGLSWLGLSKRRI